MFGIAAAVIASSKGRPFGLWFFVGLLLGVIGLIIAIAMPTTPEAEAKRATEVNEAKTQSGRVRCPYCAELIQEQAIVCRFCGRDVAPTSATEVAVIPPEGLAARRAPRPHEEIVKRLEGNQQVTVTKRQEAWAQVKTADGEEWWLDGRRLL